MVSAVRSAFTYLIQSIPDITVIDIVEMIILAFIFYNVAVWVKNTRAWTLLKGIVVLLVFFLVAYIFNMQTILYLGERAVNVAIIAVVIVFQPELRRALEQLGQNNMFASLFTSGSQDLVDRQFTEKTANEIVRASFDMGRHMTGALIVIERKTPLAEYERTGIELDAIVSSQLLINIFEHNTPLHDGAVVVRGNRVTAATCYLPLSDNMEISKELGTRHRAAVGVSESSDSLTVVVSEETGLVSLAYDGQLTRGMKQDELKAELCRMMLQETDQPKRSRFWRARGRNANETKAS